MTPPRKSSHDTLTRYDTRKAPYPSCKPPPYKPPDVSRGLGRAESSWDFFLSRQHAGNMVGLVRLSGIWHDLTSQRIGIDVMIFMGFQKQGMSFDIFDGISPAKYGWFECDLTNRWGLMGSWFLDRWKNVDQSKCTQDNQAIRDEIFSYIFGHCYLQYLQVQISINSWSML